MIGTLEEDGHMKTETQGACHMMTKAETELCSHKPGNTKNGQQTARSQEEARMDSPTSFRGSMALETL